MLSAHYRSPLNFSADLMESSKNALERIITSVEKLKEGLVKSSRKELNEIEAENLNRLEELKDKFEAFMEDDFNTADAVSAVFEIVKLANSTADENSSGKYLNKILNTINTCGASGRLHRNSCF